MTVNKKLIISGVAAALITGGVLLETGSPLDTQLDTAVVPLVFSDGKEDKQIRFEYTDDTSSENLIIRTSTSTFSSWSDQNIEFAIKNASGKDQNTTIQFLFDGQGQITKLEEYKLAQAYEEKVAEPSTAVCPDTDICEATYKTVVKFKDEWSEIIKKDTLSKTAKDKPIADKFVLKDEIEYWIPKDETKYFRAKLVFPPKTSGQFYIVAKGHNGGYGQLDPWYSSSWPYRKTITLDYTKIGTTTPITSFPILFSSTSNDFKYTSHGGHMGTTTAVDIVITESDGTTKIPHEIEKYSSSTGETILWFRTSTSTPISTSTNTTFYLYYGNSGASDQQDKTNVWDSNYKVVTHLKEASGTAASDSTSNAYSLNQTNSPTQSTGKIDGSLTYNGSNQYSTQSSAATIVNPSSSNLTIEGWFNVSSFALSGGYAQRAINQTIDANNAVQVALGLDSGVSSNFTWVIKDGGTSYQNAAPASLSTGTWYYYVFTWNTSSNTPNIYKNGVIETKTAQSTFGYGTANNTLYYGIRSDLAGYYNGLLDEVRISNTERSLSWIQTSYNNQSSTSTFYTLGGEETPTVIGRRRIFIID